MAVSMITRVHGAMGQRRGEMSASPQIVARLLNRLPQMMVCDADRAAVCQTLAELRVLLRGEVQGKGVLAGEPRPEEAASDRTGLEVPQTVARHRELGLV